jgi:hypothetical protein
MDPFSITVGTFTLAEVCYRLVVFMRNIPAALAAIQTEIDTLVAVVESLQTTAATIEPVLQRLGKRPSTPFAPGTPNRADLVKQCKQTLSQCKTNTGRLDTLVRKIYGIYGEGSVVTGKMDGLLKELRRRDMSADLQRLRGELSGQKQTLELWLTILLV